MNAAVSFSERFDQALILASLAHAGVSRKGSTIPYITHPVHVARLLERHGFSEDVAIAGLLHDVLEDADFAAASLQDGLRQTFIEFAHTDATDVAFRAATEAFITERFSDEILKLILAVTEIKHDGSNERPWRIRKEEQLVHIPRMSQDAAALKAADALHNAQSILRDVRRSGLKMFDRFNCSPEETLWHYGALADGLRSRLSKHPLTLELDDVAFELTQEVDRLLSNAPESSCSFCGADHSAETECLRSNVTRFVVTNGRGRRIRSLAHWRRLAPPAGGDFQWVPGRSALEAARAWSGLIVPVEVLHALRAATELDDFRATNVLAEWVTPLDEFGEGRNHDLILLGVAHGTRVLVGIEAKNDEELGPEIGKYIARTESKNRARVDRGTTRLSRVTDRIANLTRLIFGTRPVDLTNSRYQLLHGLGGTLIEAARRHAKSAVFLVHIFESPSSNPSKLKRNEADILRFADVLQPDGGRRLRADGLLGPIAAGGDSVVPDGFPFYFGVARVTCDAVMPHS